MQIDNVAWTEDMLHDLTANLLEQSTIIQACVQPGLEEGTVQLSYRSQFQDGGNDYSALYAYVIERDGVYVNRYVEVNFNLDFGGGTPFPVNIEDGKLCGARYVCGHSREELFDLGIDSVR